jgi:hypothetical protein
VDIFILMWAFLYDCGRLYMTVGVLYITVGVLYHCGCIIYYSGHFYINVGVFI